MPKKKQLVPVKQQLVFKTPQSLIHIKHNISLLQYKFWFLLLQDLKEQMDDEIPAYVGGFRYVSMEAISEKLGYTPSKKDIFDCLRALKKQDLAINFLEKNGVKAKYGAGFISEWTVSSNRIGYKFPLFLELVMTDDKEAKKIFQLLNWDIFNSFTGKYEAIIYKLCKDYVGIERTPYMTMAKYREYIGLDNDEYPETRDFNKRCITGPVKSINESELSDISVAVEYTRVGRKVEGLYFTTEKKQPKAIPLPEFKQHPAFDHAKVSISAPDQVVFLEKYTPEQIQASIERANEYCEDLERQGKPANYGGIYVKAIEDNWGAQHQERKALEEKKRTSKKVQKEPALEADKQDNSSATAERVAANKALIERFRALPEEEQHALIEACIKAQKEPLKAMAKKNYAKMNLGILERPSFTTLLCPFLQKYWNDQPEAVV